MSSEKRILIISLGSIGKRHLMNTRKLLPDAKIAVYRQYVKENISLPEGADHIYYDLQEARDFKPGAVIIASPANEHEANAKLFNSDGAHLFIEKPLSNVSDNLLSLVEQIKTSPKFTMVGYVLRFLPTLKFIKDLIDGGEIGRVLTAHVQVGQYLPDWRPGTDYRQGVSAQENLGGGALLELSHELDYSLWLFGKPDSILCSRDRLSDLEIDVEDSAHVIYEYKREQEKKKVIVQLDFLQRVANMAIQIVTSEGTLCADLIKEEVVLFSPSNQQGKVLDAPRTKEGNEIYLRQFDFFFANSFTDYAAIYPETNDFKDWVDIEHASDVVKLIDDAKVSDRQGKRINFS